MKRFFILFTCFISLIVVFSCSSHPTADDILARYMQVSGLDKLSDKEQQSVKFEMVLSSGPMGMPIKGFIKYPSQYRLEMPVGPGMLMVVDGQKGWMVIGPQKTEMPQSLIAEMVKQNDITNSMKWDKARYDFQLLEPMSKDGKNYDVVKITPKKEASEDITLNEQTVYFDNATGLVAYIESKMNHEGRQMEIKTVIEETQTINNILTPKVITLYTGDTKMTEITVNDMQFGYQADDSIFAEPKVAIQRLSE